MWDTWKNSKPGLQFFHVSHIREITLIRCHSGVIPVYVFAVYKICGDGYLLDPHAHSRTHACCSVLTNQHMYWKLRSTQFAIKGKTPTSCHQSDFVFYEMNNAILALGLNTATCLSNESVTIY